MPKVRVAKDQDKKNRWLIECPACGNLHQLDERWNFNGDIDKPTFSPSLLVNGDVHYINPAVPRCHSFITDGKIQFLNDCTHALAGQTVELPEWE